MESALDCSVSNVKEAEVLTTIFTRVKGKQQFELLFLFSWRFYKWLQNALGTCLNWDKMRLLFVRYEKNKDICTQTYWTHSKEVTCNFIF